MRIVIVEFPEPGTCIAYQHGVGALITRAVYMGGGWFDVFTETKRYSAVLLIGAR